MALGWDVVEVDTGAPAPLREGPRGLAAIRASARDTLELWIDRGRGLYEAAPEPIPSQVCRPARPPPGGAAGARGPPRSRPIPADRPGPRPRGSPPGPP